MNQYKLPLYNALIEYRNKEPHSFHVPGHKNGSVLPNQAEQIYKSVLSIDVTELTGLDDLHHSSGVIREAEDLAACLYGSKRCFFLVGGSTVGNLAMIMATCTEGDTVIVQRNSHKSILNGLRLAKVQPIFLEPSFDSNAQIPGCLDELDVINAIKKYPNSKAIIITRPNYYGYINTLENMIKVAHNHNMVVLVDEAHGAHFGHPSSLLPKSAIYYGADIVVQSAHKTLPAMTMGSFLHYNSNIANLDKLKFYLQMLQSSSPSYPIMASLDIARFYLATLTEKELATILDTIKQFKRYLQGIPQLKVIGNNEYEIDPLKVTIQCCCQLTGFELQKLLEEEGIFTELADQFNVLFVMPLAKTSELISIGKKIKSKLKNIEVKKQIEKIKNTSVKKISKLEFSFTEMAQLEIEIVSLVKSIGKVIAEEIIPYPPGIPLLISGERIEQEHIDSLFRLKGKGAYFQGRDIFHQGIKVFKIDKERGPKYE